MLNRNNRRMLCAVCVLQTTVIVALDLPAWVVIAMMIAPITLFVDCIVTIVKGRKAK